MSGRLALLVLAVLLGVPALALASHLDPKERIAPADQRKAATIVLKRTDLVTGWKQGPSSNNDDDHLDCSFYNPNGSDLTITGKSEAEFERAGGIPSIVSFADVYVSPKDAVAGWTQTVKPALARCLAQVFTREAARPGTKVTILKQGSISFPRVAPRTAAFRIGLRIAVKESGQTRTVPLTIHIVAVGRGRAEAGLLTIAPGQGLAGADLRLFAKLLAERMRKAGF